MPNLVTVVTELQQVTRLARQRDWHTVETESQSWGGTNLLLASGGVLNNWLEAEFDHDGLFVEGRLVERKLSTGRGGLRQQVVKTERTENWAQLRTWVDTRSW